jgi:hypothetical protein
VTAATPGRALYEVIAARFTDELDTWVDWDELEDHARPIYEDAAQAAITAAPVNARLRLALCGDHPGEVHAQILDAPAAGPGAWACLRALADTAEAAVAGAGDDGPPPFAPLTPEEAALDAEGEDEQRQADLRAHVSGTGGPSPDYVTDDAAGLRGAGAYKRHLDQVFAPVKGEVKRLRTLLAAEQEREAAQHARDMGAEDGDLDDCEPAL